MLKTIKINDSIAAELDILKNEFIANEARYLNVSQRCNNFPEKLLFALHDREADLNFKTCLHNGDRLPGPTRHVPKGRGPFNSWEDAAVDAIMVDKGIFPATWTLENQLAFAERYNGLGYRKHNIYSPYIFSGTNFYTSGKYASDGNFDSSEVDGQIGVAAIILSLSEV